MKNHDSIASRLSTMVTIIMVLTVLLISAAVYWRANRMVSNEMENSAFAQMEMICADVDEVAQQAMDVCDGVAMRIPRYVDSSHADVRALDSLAQLVMKGNTQLKSCVIALAKGNVAPMIVRNAEGELESLKLDSLMPGYAKRKWFVQIQNNWQSSWVNPQVSYISPCFYVSPIFSHDSAFLGVVGVEMQSDWIDNQTRSIRIFDHSYCLLLTEDGTCLNNPDISILFKESLATDPETTRAEIQRQVNEHAHDMQHGTSVVHTQEFRATAFFTPIKTTGWEIAVVCPFTDAYRGLDSFLIFNLIVILFFSVMLVVVINIAVKRATAPLSEFAEMARKVAVGEFDAPLPENGEHSEMSDLYDSFSFMQQSLSSNIEELKRTTAEQERLESEFHIARKIQLDLVPNIFPAFPDRKDIDVHAVINPWREVGGNLYDFGIVDNKLIFCIGDVSGKGILAAVFMSMTFKLVHTSLFTRSSPSQVLAFANNAMAQNNESNMFVTLFYGVLDLETGDLEYCNAGQDEPMVVAPDGSVTPLEVLPNIPVGVMEDTEYEQQHAHIEPGSMIVLYTDGVVEAANRSGDLYGKDRLRRLLARHSKSTCETVDNAIRDDVREFTCDQSKDDCTALAIRWK